MGLVPSEMNAAKSDDVSIIAFTSREFNRDVSRAKKASKLELVFITNRDKPEHVLLAIGQYHRLKGEKSNLLDALSMPGLADIDFDHPQVCIESHSALS